MPPLSHSPKGEMSRWAWLLLLLWILQDQNQGVAWALFTSGGSGDESTLKLIRVVGQILFFAVIQPRPLFLCRLSAGDLSQLLIGICTPHHIAPSTFKAAKVLRVLLTI